MSKTQVQHITHPFFAVTILLLNNLWSHWIPFFGAASLQQFSFNRYSEQVTPKANKYKQ